MNKPLRCAVAVIAAAGVFTGIAIGQGGPLSGPVTTDLGIKPLPVAPKESDFWLSETVLAGKGKEVKVNTTFDWSKVTATSGGPVGDSTPGSLERPFWLPYPWQDLPYVDMQPLRGQSMPGGRNYARYQEWEARALNALPPLDRAAMNEKKWVTQSGVALGAAVRSPIAQFSFTANADGSVQGTVWLAKLREPADPSVKGSKERLHMQQIPITGNLDGDMLQFEAAGLRGALKYVGKGYGLRGEFDGKTVNSLVSPLFREAWTNVQATVKKPIPEPTKSTTSYGAPVTKWE